MDVNLQFMCKFPCILSSFLLKGVTWSPRLLIHFKHKNPIQDKKIVLEEQKMDMAVAQ